MKLEQKINFNFLLHLNTSHFAMITCLLTDFPSQNLLLLSLYFSVVKQLKKTKKFFPFFYYLSHISVAFLRLNVSTFSFRHKNKEKKNHNETLGMFSHSQRFSVWKMKITKTSMKKKNKYKKFFGNILWIYETLICSFDDANGIQIGK